jgi:mitochondrial Rho GTPase 1
VPHDCSVELSTLGVKFLTETFTAFDKVSIRLLLADSKSLLYRQDHDGALKQEELEDLFSTSPGNPWANQRFPDTTVTSDEGAVTLQGWLAQWRSVDCMT